MKQSSIFIQDRRPYDRPTVSIVELMSTRTLLAGSTPAEPPVTDELPITPEGWPEGIPTPW